MGSQSFRQQQYALDLADKSRRRSAPRAHIFMEVSPLTIWTPILSIHVNVPGEAYYRATENVYWVSTKGSYSMKIDKTTVQLLGEPYSKCRQLDSDATSEDADAINIFGGGYTQEKVEFKHYLATNGYT